MQCFIPIFIICIDYQNWKLKNIQWIKNESLSLDNDVSNIFNGLIVSWNYDQLAKIKFQILKV